MVGRIIQNSNIIEVRQGDSFTIRIQFAKKCDAMDLAGATIKMQVRSMDDDSLLWSIVADPVEAKKGIFALCLTPNETNIAPGDYKTDIQLELPNGSIHTFFPEDVKKVGVFRITEQVTK